MFNQIVPHCDHRYAVNAENSAKRVNAAHKVAVEFDFRQLEIEIHGISTAKGISQTICSTETMSSKRPVDREIWVIGIEINA